MDVTGAKYITNNFEKLLDNTKLTKDNEFVDTQSVNLIIGKLKVNERIEYNRILQFFDLYKFMISRENENTYPDKLGLSYRPVTDMNIKSIQNMINFLWVKIEEKFTKTSHAFRFFDEKCRSKVSYKEFEQAISKLKIKFHKDDIREIFKYLDVNKDKYLDYIEFAKLNRNSNFTSRMPCNEGDAKKSTGENTRISTRAKSNDYAIRDNNDGKFRSNYLPL